jgi:hypothetical protein
MLPTFSGDMLFCVTSARNAVISAVSAVDLSYLLLFDTAKILLIEWAVKDKKKAYLFAVDLLYLHR